MRGPLGVTYGKHGFLPLPAVRDESTWMRVAWADTPVLTTIGALLIAAAALAWLAVMS